MTLSAFLMAWALHLMAAASPGPAVLMTARTGISAGFRQAAWLTCGIGIGAVIWAAAALFGLALLFKLAPALFWGYKIAGGLFLLWIAIKMWRHATDPLDAPGAGASGPRRPLFLMRKGITTQLANPKPAVFFGAVFAGTVPPGTPPLWILALLVMVLVNEVACNLLIAGFFSLDHTRRIYTRMKTGIDRGFAGILGCLGLKIALD